MVFIFLSSCMAARRPYMTQNMVQPVYYSPVHTQQNRWYYSLNNIYTHPYLLWQTYKSTVSNLLHTPQTTDTLSLLYYIDHALCFKITSFSVKSNLSKVFVTRWWRCILPRLCLVLLTNKNVLIAILCFAPSYQVPAKSSLTFLLLRSSTCLVLFMALWVIITFVIGISMTGQHRFGIKLYW